MIKLGEVVMIFDLHRQGMTVSAIARELGLDRKTVRRCIKRGLEAPLLFRELLLFARSCSNAVGRRLDYVVIDATHSWVQKNKSATTGESGEYE